MRGQFYYNYVKGTACTVFRYVVLIYNVSCIADTSVCNKFHFIYYYFFFSKQDDQKKMQLDKYFHLFINHCI